MNLAATRTIDILFFVSKNKYSSTISNISRELDIPKSTVFHIVHSLTESGMLQVQDARRMTYRIGCRAYELGLSYIAQNHVLEVVHQELLSLTAAVRMSGGYFSVRDGALVLMDMVPFSGSAYPNYHIGARFDPLEIPAGYAYLSTLPPETLAQAADSPAGGAGTHSGGRAPALRHRHHGRRNCGHLRAGAGTGGALRRGAVPLHAGGSGGCGHTAVRRARRAAERRADCPTRRPV